VAWIWRMRGSHFALICLEARPHLAHSNCLSISLSFPYTSSLLIVATGKIILRPFHFRLLISFLVNLTLVIPSQSFATSL
jgi:hypothetical protein